MGGVGGSLGGGVGGFLVGGPAGAVVGSLVGNQMEGMLSPSKPKIQASGSEKELKRMAAETYAAGAPIRTQYLTDALALLQGNKDVTDLPGYATQIGLMERNIGDAFGQAREQILENAPVGNQGAVVRNLGEAATGLAEKRGSLAQMIADAMLQNYMGNAFGLASGGMTAGMSGMQSAASVAAQRAAAEAQAANAATANRNALMGTGADLFLGGANLYGKGQGWWK